MKKVLFVLVSAMIALPALASDHYLNSNGGNYDVWADTQVIDASQELAAGNSFAGACQEGATRYFTNDGYCSNGDIRNTFRVCKNGVYVIVRQTCVSGR